MDHVRNDDIRSQLRQEGVVEQEKMKFGRMGRRANWIYDRDSDERNCTREKTKREAKKVMERCLLIDAKIWTFAVQDYFIKLHF